jgi:hypothetical protein
MKPQKVSLWIVMSATYLALQACGGGGNETDPISSTNAVSLNPAMGVWASPNDTNCYQRTDPATQSPVYVKSQSVEFTTISNYIEKIGVYTDPVCTVYDHTYIALYSVTWLVADPDVQGGSLTSRIQIQLTGTYDEHANTVLPFAFTSPTDEGLISVGDETLYLGSLDWSIWTAYRR